MTVKKENLGIRARRKKRRRTIDDWLQYAGKVRRKTARQGTGTVIRRQRPLPNRDRRQDYGRVQGSVRSYIAAL